MLLFNRHCLRAIIEKKPDSDILKLAKAKNSKIISEKYIKDLDSDIKSNLVKKGWGY